MDAKIFFKDHGKIGDTLNMVIGQGSLLLTPIQNGFSLLLELLIMGAN